MLGGGRKAKDSSERRVEWDEDNLRTHEESVLRGEYGTMKIDEPKTPFAAPGSPVVGTPEEEGLEKLYLSSREKPVATMTSSSQGGGPKTLDDLVGPDFSLDPETLPQTRFAPGEASGTKRNEAKGQVSLDGRYPEEKKKQKVFEEKRRSHYNMREALARSRALIEQELAELDDDGDEAMADRQRQLLRPKGR